MSDSIVHKSMGWEITCFVGVVVYCCCCYSLFFFPLWRWYSRAVVLLFSWEQKRWNQFYHCYTNKRAKIFAFNKLRQIGSTRLEVWSMSEDFKLKIFIEGFFCQSVLFCFSTKNATFLFKATYFKVVAKGSWQSLCPGNGLFITWFNITY